MGVKISAIEIFLPDLVLTNEQLASEFGRWDSDKIENKLGIKERHIAAKDETAGDLAFNAAEKVLEGYDRTRIDMLLLCTQSPDYFLPTTACVLQDRLKLRTNIGAFDFNLGCSGFIYGLAMAKAFINTGIANNVLLLTAETYSKHIHSKDLANKTIFGDGASATLIERTDVEHILNFILGTDGSGKNNLMVPNGGFRKAYNPDAADIITETGDIYTENNLFMSGSDIFSFTIESVPIAFEQCLNINKLTVGDIDYVIFHQANKYMIDYLRKKIGIPKEKFYANMMHTGNTVSSTIPIAYADALKNGMIVKGNKILLCGFGVGYSWGAVVVEV